MTSPQRQNALDALARWQPLTPKQISDQIGCSPEAARQLIRRMVADGQLRREDGAYALAEAPDTPPSEASEGHEAQHISHRDDAGESHGVTPERHDVTEESNAVTEETEQSSPGYPSRIGTGVFVYDAKTGRSVPWRNKALEGPYP